jgi:hypothetical protein
MKCSRMTSITQENPIGRPRLKLIKPTLLENEAPTTKSPEMAHSRCSPVHELIACLVQEGSQKNLVPNMASGIHRLSQYLLGVLCSSSIVQAISQRERFSSQPHHSDKPHREKKIDV